MADKSCESCSLPVRDEMKFCPGCGHSLVSDQQNEEPGTVAAAEDAHPKPSVKAETARDRSDKPRVPVETKGGKSWIVGVVFGLVLLIGFFAIAIAESVDQTRISKRGELAAQACANIIGQHVPEVKSASVESHTVSVERVRVKFRTVKNGVVGKIANCEYSMQENILSIENIDWTFEPENIETEVSYDRDTNIVNFERVPRPAVKAKSSSESNTSCESAFRAAAAVPLSRDNNAEIAQTTRSCSDVDEWWSTLKRYPDVFGVVRFSESERGLYVGSACIVGGGSPVCRDADARGIGF